LQLETALNFDDGPGFDIAQNPTHLIGNEIRRISNNHDRTLTLEKGNLAKGIYFIQVQGNKTYFGKVMVN